MKLRKITFFMVISVVISFTIFSFNQTSYATQQKNPLSLTAAHNSFDGGSPDATWQKALDLNYHNLELDIMVDASHSTYNDGSQQDGRLKLFVNHDLVSYPNTRNLREYFEDIYQSYLQNGESVYGNGESITLTIDLKNTNNPNWNEVAQSLQSIFEQYSDMLTTSTIGVPSSYEENAVIVILSGDEHGKNAYYDLINSSSGQLYAYKDRVISVTDPYLNDVEAYFNEEANEYLRSLAVHWKHIEFGFPFSLANWSQESQNRLEQFLQKAEERHLMVRFYSLNGEGGPIYYRFPGGLGDAKQRWAQFFEANQGLNLQHFISTDDYDQLSSFYSYNRLPLRNFNGNVLKPNSNSVQNGVAPGVSIKGRTVIEVHKAELSGALWYSVGQVEDDGDIDWLTNERIQVNGSNKSGVNPDVAFGFERGQDIIIQVNKSEWNSGLWYNYGILNNNQTINWITNERINNKNGVQPKIAINGNQVIQVNKSQSNNGLWYNTGYIDSENNQINWVANERIDNQEGENPDIDVREDNQVLSVFTKPDGNLGYSIGKLGHNMVIDWESSGDITTPDGSKQKGNTPTVAFLDNNYILEMHNSPTTGKIWVNIGELTGNTIKWKENFVWDSGVSNAPSVDYDKTTNRLIDIHQSGGLSQELWYNSGYISSINE